MFTNCNMMSVNDITKNFEKNIFAGNLAYIYGYLMEYAVNRKTKTNSKSVAVGFLHV